MADIATKVWYVSALHGADTYPGKSESRPFLTVQAAINRATEGDTIYVGPGEYEENVTIPRAKSNLKLIGTGSRGSAYIAALTDGVALTIIADDCLVQNLGLEGDGTGGGVKNYGRRTRLIDCKMEGGAIALDATMATVAQEAADTHGDGSDVMVIGCEICWSTRGVMIRATDYGAVTQLRLRGCSFHDNSAADIDETGGTASIRFRGLEIANCVFQRIDDGTEPTAYILLNDDNTNAGQVSGCVFPSAINGGKNLVSTKLFWVSNFHTGGISTGQPS